MDRAKTARNVAILLLIAAVVEFVPGAGRTTNTFQALLEVLLLAGFVYFGYRLYREHRVSVYGLGERQRALLYGGLALVVFAVVAASRMWQSDAGEIAWFLLVGAAVYALLVVYRSARTY